MADRLQTVDTGRNRANNGRDITLYVGTRDRLPHRPIGVAILDSDGPVEIADALEAAAGAIRRLVAYGGLTT